MVVPRSTALERSGRTSTASSWTPSREAATEGKSLDDHITHLIVHGFLHLLGYDHEVEAEADIMEGLEVKALATLGIADPYRDMAA